LKHGQGVLYGIEVINSLLECPELIKKHMKLGIELLGNERKTIKKKVYIIPKKL
jgi:hypothetical protein